MGSRERVPAAEGDATAPDTILARRVLAGDQEAFETLVQRYTPLLFQAIASYVSEYDEVCDLVQQVLVQWYLSFATLDKERPFKSWLFQVARHRCIDHLRHKRAISFSQWEAASGAEGMELLQAIADPQSLPDDVVEQQETQREVWDAIQSLPDRARRIVLLHGIAQCTYVEIAQLLAIPETTARTSFHRAKPLLRRAIERQTYLASRSASDGTVER